MSSFDEAFRSHAAQQEAQQRQYEDKQRLVTEAAAPIIQRVVAEFVRKLQAENVPPQQLRMGTVWSPSGYIIDSSAGSGSGVSSFTLVTPDRRVFTYSLHGKESGFVAITPENIRNLKTGWFQQWKALDIAEDGQLLANVGYEHNDWQPFEKYLIETLAAKAVSLKRQSLNRQPYNMYARFAGTTPTRMGNKLEAMRLEMEELRRQIDREKASNNRRKEARLIDKLYRLSLKYSKMEKRS